MNRRLSRMKGWPALCVLAAFVVLGGIVVGRVSAAPQVQGKVAAGASGGGKVTTMRMANGNVQMVMLSTSGRGPTWSEVVQVYRRLSVARAATARFRDVALAQRDGYRRLNSGPYVDFFNARLVPGTVDAFNPSAPPYLIYRNAGGTLSLSGVMYALPGGATQPQLARVFPASLAGWQQQVLVCRPGKSPLPQQQAATIHDRGACEARGGTFVPAGAWTVQAWLWEGHGLFDSEADAVQMSMSSVDMSMAMSGRKPMRMTEGAMQMVMIPTTGLEPTWHDLATVYRKLAKIKAVTQKYRDVRVAERDGYVTAKVLFVKGQGAHYVKLDAGLLLGTSTDPFASPVLVYDRMAGQGKQTLLGLMFLMPRSATVKQLDAVFPGSMALWHTHINNCVEAGKLVAIHNRATCRAGGGLFVKTLGWMTHAWLWHTSTPLFATDM